MKRTLYLILLLPLVFISCKRNGVGPGNDFAHTGDVVDTVSFQYGATHIGDTILLPMIGMDCALNGKLLSSDEWKAFFHENNYTLVNFIRKEQCSVCIMKMIFWWDEFADKLGRDNIDYCFIVHPDDIYSLDELVSELNKVYFSFPVFFDFQGLFIDANGFYGNKEMPDCVLLDKDRRIIAIGSTEAPSKMRKEFKVIVGEASQK